MLRRAQAFKTLKANIEEVIRKTEIFFKVSENWIRRMIELVP